jgi:hypothetical protein
LEANDKASLLGLAMNPVFISVTDKKISLVVETLDSYSKPPFDERAKFQRECI